VRFRFWDVVKYAYRLNLFNSIHLLFQTLVNRKTLLIKPIRGGSLVLRNNSSDVLVFKQVFLWEEYNYPIKGSVDVIIDAGANIGCATRWFKNKYTKAKIVAIEPEGKNFRILQRNTMQLDNVYCIQAGLWSKKAHLLIETSDDNWTFQVKESNDVEGSILALSINDVIERMQLNKIDILKLDVETSEKQIFKENFEQWIPKTRYIIVETHDFISKGCSRSVFETILKYNFSVSVLGENIILINDDLQ
jgi:FkbM family methyltransferase